MEFTKEQIEFIKSKWVKFSGKTYSEFLDSLLKPERKEIIVKIESNIVDTIGILNRLFQGDLSIRQVPIKHEWKAIQLPEVFTRQDILKIFNHAFSDLDYVNLLIDRWIERKQK